MIRRVPEWLKDAVIYQVYPQSFSDSNGDGTGDLAGITARMDYIASLGVSAVWINPFFASPMNDAGYDVADYYAIHPRYGTMGDFHALVEAAHARGIRVIFDLVVGHCSWENAWFRASGQEARNAYSDWFIWTDNVWAGGPPGMEIIRGLLPRMGGYLTNFFVSQPALNFGFARPDPRHPWQQPVDAPGPRAVREEVKRIIRYWFDHGADGFRADMALSLVKGDLDGSATADFWCEVREMLDRDYPDHAMIAEGGSPRVAVGLGGFHVDFCLPWRMPAYNSLFRKNVTNEGGSTVGVDSYGFSVFDGQGHGNIREFMDEFERHYAAVREVGFIAIPEGNHDLHPRLSFNRTPGEALQALLFTFTMPGVPFLYYGDEIGMRTLMGLPSKEGSYDRSGIRTPMQWDGSPNAGFSTAAPERLYLPVDPAPDRPTVTEQERDPGSMLNRTRALIALKRAHPALRADAAWRPLYAARGEMPIVYERSCEGARVIVAINPTLRPASVALALEGVSGCPRALWGAPDVFVQEGERWRVSLPPASGGVYEVASAPIFTNS